MTKIQKLRSELRNSLGTIKEVILALDKQKEKLVETKEKIEKQIQKLDSL